MTLNFEVPNFQCMVVEGDLIWNCGPHSAKCGLKILQFTAPKDYTKSPIFPPKFI